MLNWPLDSAYTHCYRGQYQASTNWSSVGITMADATVCWHSSSFCLIVGLFYVVVVIIWIIAVALNGCIVTLSLLGYP